MLIQSVIAGNLDAAFILHQPDNALLNTVPIKAGKVGVVLPAEHPLAQQHEIAFSDLANETLILFPRETNPEMFDDVITHFQQSGFSPKQIIETAPRSSAIALVAAGQGIATIAQSLKQTCIAGTIFKPLKQPAPMISYSCITLKQRKGQWLEVLTKYIGSELQ